MSNDWQMAAADLFLSASCFSVAGYVYNAGNTYYPRLFLTVICVGGISILVNIRGLHMVFWAYPSMIAVYYIHKPKISILINILLILTILPKLYSITSISEFLTIVFTLCLTNFFGYVFSINTDQQNKKLAELAWFDGLTGVRNRRALDQRLEEAAERDNQISIIILDIDNFKKINDCNGHTFGDEVLTRIASVVNDRIRSTDTLYRYGGEEFVIVSVDTDLENAAKLAEELRTLVESHIFVGNYHVTISLGVAELKIGESMQEWFSRGDKALFTAKNSGRNRTCVSTY